MTGSHSTMKFAAVLSMAVIFSACGPSGGGTSTPSTVSGRVIMGPVEGAEVEVYELNDDGTEGNLIGSDTTDADGNYSVDDDGEGARKVVSKGGTYTDEATGETVTIPSGNELVTLIAAGTGKTNIGVTALTTIAAARANSNAAAGLANAIANANKDVATEFGIDGVDISDSDPDDFTDDIDDEDPNSDKTKHGLALAAVTQMAKDAGLSADDVPALVQAMADDYSDGAFDGKKGAAPLTTALAVTPEMALNGLEAASDNFLDNSARNRSSIKRGELAVMRGGAPAR